MKSYIVYNHSTAPITIRDIVINCNGTPKVIENLTNSELNILRVMELQNKIRVVEMPQTNGSVHEDTTPESPQAKRGRKPKE